MSPRNSVYDYVLKTSESRDLKHLFINVHFSIIHISKSLHITSGGLLSLRRKGFWILVYALSKVNLEEIMLSKMSVTKNKYCEVLRAVKLEET